MEKLNEKAMHNIKLGELKRKNTGFPNPKVLRLYQMNRKKKLERKKKEKNNFNCKLEPLMPVATSFDHFLAVWSVFCSALKAVPF